MKTKLLLLLTFLSLNLTFYSQICGTTAPQNYQKHNRTKSERGFDKTNIQMHPIICIDIKYHIVRNNNHTGGLNPNQINNITESINESFNTHNLFFNNTGYDFIDNTDLLNLDEGVSEFNELVNYENYSNSNVINIFIVNELWDVYDNNGVYIGFISGRANGIPSNDLVIRSDFTIDDTMPHEIGHCLNLLHTFQGTSIGSNGCAEFIESSMPNCEDCGDKVCDTPADSNQGNSNGYMPDLTNYMSYYFARNHFTDGQELRMRDAIFAENILQSITSNSCSIPNISSNGNVSCENLSVTFNLENAEPPINWTYSENLELIESTNTYITLKAINNEDNGLSFVQANFGFDVELRETFWVGIPTEPRKFTAATMNFPDAPTNYYFELDKTTQGNSRQGVVLEREYDIKPTIMYDEGQNETETSVWLTTPSNVGIRLDYSYRYRNPCGWSVWSRVHGYTVDSGGGGWNMPEPFPNSSDESFKLDFRNKPPTTQFYIYLYDQYSNIKYQGESNNVEKTIDTMNLQNGVYYLHVYENGELKTKQIFVNH